MLRHVILSHCSHGITGQSTLAVRMGADTGASFLHAAIGGFSVGSGSYHQGGLERAMMEVSMAQKSGDPEKYTREKLARNEILYGFGHRFQTRDVRARLLMRLCEEYSFLQDHVACVKVMDGVMGEEKGVHMNIEQRLRRLSSLLVEALCLPQLTWNVSMSCGVRESFSRRSRSTRSSSHERWLSKTSRFWCGPCEGSFDWPAWEKYDAHERPPDDPLHSDECIGRDDAR